MKKFVLLLTIALLLTIFVSCGSKSAAPVDTEDAISTTDSVDRADAEGNASTEYPVEDFAEEYMRPDLPKCTIMFLDIQWGTPENIAIELVKERFPDINTVEEESYPDRYRESENFSDPQSLVFPSYSSRAVETKLVTLQHSGGSGQYSYTSSLGSVAGYSVRTIFLYFIYQDGEYRLYEAVYGFDDSKDMEPLGQFTDLQNKITNLYGEPETYTYDSSIATDATHACAVWDGGDSSAAYLEYTLYLSGYLNGDESVWLHYGTTSFNNFFVNAEDERLAREEAEQKEKIDAIESDYSGL